VSKSVRTPSAPVVASPNQTDAFARISDHCQHFRGAAPTRSIGQLVLNLSLYGGLIAAMYGLVAIGAWWAALLLSVPASGILMRLFIIQHDCGHGAFFKSKRANHAVGWLVSVLSFTPYGFWRDAHNRHHANSGNLTKRGMGGVDTLTVEEFKRLTPRNKALYKFYRHPLTLLVFGPPVYFLLLQRLPMNADPMPYTEVYFGMKGPRIWQSVMLLNLALVVFYGGLAFLFGGLATLIVIAPTVSLAGIAGSWLFYVQHQYEDAYWAERKDWNYNAAALLGSSHYDLPRILQWFTGNIGLHHIHHLCSLIPNYRLQECYDASPELQALPKLSIRDSFKSPGMTLWDEQSGRMVGFSAVQ
jgi:acyl-lipid omega-6 desaturase (Delta-12 desaturase)